MDWEIVAGAGGALAVVLLLVGVVRQLGRAGRHGLPDVWGEGQKWVLGAKSEPLLSMAAAPVGASASVAAASVVPEEVRERVLALLKLAPEPLQALVEDGGGVELSLSPTLIEGAKEGGMGLVEGVDGIPSAVLDASGRVLGNPDVITTAVTVVAVGAVAWKLAAVATQQKYLADIEERLAGIEDRLRYLERWERDKVRSLASGNLTWLGGVARSLARGNYTSVDATAWAHQLATIDREMHQLMNGVEGHLEEQSPVVPDRWRRVWSRKLVQQTTSVCEDANRYADFCEVWTLGALARAVALDLRGALPVDDEHTRHELRQLSGQVDEFAGRHPETIANGLARAVVRMRSWFGRRRVDGSRDELRGVVYGRLFPIRDRVQRLGSQVQAIRTGEPALDVDQGMRVLVQRGDEGLRVVTA